MSDRKPGKLVPWPTFMRGQSDPLPADLSLEAIRKLSTPDLQTAYGLTFLRVDRLRQAVAKAELILANLATVMRENGHPI